MRIQFPSRNFIMHERKHKKKDANQKGGSNKRNKRKIKNQKKDVDLYMT